MAGLDEFFDFMSKRHGGKNAPVTTADYHAYFKHVLEAVTPSSVAIQRPDGSVEIMPIDPKAGG